MNWCEFPGYLMGFDALQRYGCRMADGLVVTLMLVSLSVSVGFALGVGLAILRTRGLKSVRMIVFGYITFFRGTPLLCQLFLIYYGLGAFRLFWQDVGLWWLFRDPFYCCLLAFTINTAAYQAEIIRGSLQALPKGQIEAAHALGMRPLAIFLRVELPQAFVISLRPLGNELITMLKSSAIASLVTIFDLMGATRFAFARSFDLNLYVVAAMVYLCIVEMIRRIWMMIELKLTRHLRIA